MVYISVIVTHILQITNHAGPSVGAAIHVLHSGHTGQQWKTHITTICQSAQYILELYILKKTISKSDNNKRILSPNDYNKQQFLCSNLLSWLGLCESDNIKRMITLTVITLSGAYCILVSKT